MTTAPVIHITGITNVLNYVAHAVLYNCMYMLECVCVAHVHLNGKIGPRKKGKKGLSAAACLDFICCSIQKKWGLYNTWTLDWTGLWTGPSWTHSSFNLFKL